MLTFLSPAPALIAAAVSVPLLLLIYFLRLRRRPLRVSSTLLWEQAARDLQVNVPFRWLRVSAILLLQLGALAALLLALARPAIKGAAPVADRVVIIIDRSASMSAHDGSERSGAANDVDRAPTRLDEAKARAVELVRDLARGTTATGERPSAMVIASAASARIVQSYTSVTADLIDAINAIEPTDQPGDIAAAAELLDAARAAAPPAHTPLSSDVAEAGSRATQERVVAFTDLPPDVRPDTHGVPMRIVRIRPRTPSETSGVPTGGPASPTPRGAPGNLGIVAFSVRRDLERPDTVHAFARIANAGPETVSTIVRCLIDGSPVVADADRSPANRGGGSARNVDVPGRTASAAGEIGLTFDFIHRSGGTVLIVIDRPDLLDADNACAAVVGAVTTPAVLVVAPGSPKPEPDEFLMGFIDSVHARALRTVDARAYADEMADARAESRRPWRGFNLVVFDRVSPAPGDVPPQATISFGAGLPVAGLTLRPTGDTRGAIRFDTWRRSDPLMRYVALDPIVISPPPAIIETAPAASPSGPGVPGPTTQPGVVPLAFGPDGPIIAAQDEPGVGAHRVVVSFPLTRSNWAPDTSFAVFMANAVDLLTGRGDAAIGRFFTTVEPVTVRPAAGATRIEVRGPASRTVDLAGEAGSGAPSAGSGSVSLGVLDLAGVYRVTGAEEATVCVNMLSEAETLLGAPGSLSTESGGSGVAPRAPSAALPDEGEQRDGRREVWHWFVLLGALLAGVEWVVFASRVRA